MVSKRSRTWLSSRAWMRRTLLLLCLLQSPLQAAELLLSSAGDTSILRGFSTALAAARPQDRVRIVPLNDLPPLNELSADTRLVLFGQPALAWRLSSQDGPPTLVLQVNKTQARATLGDRTPANLSVLWQDPAPLRQLRLAKHLLPHISRVGVLHDQQSAFLLEEIRQAATSLGLEVVSEDWPSTRDNRTLLRLLRNSDVLLGVADDDLYNPQTAKNLLLTSYGQQRALIGPSAGFVRAGSLASTYSDQNDWLETLGSLLDRSPQSWPHGTYSSAFKVLGNPQVARALAVDLPSDEDLAQHLSEGETP
ncbi:ABC transporter substrate-binding protein [Pseudomonas daroniae]|uniref:ABC transporter substrate-binding protein n=2 Tax=Phytopseudomonas daroniae TaxID=2487519 RepID=A0A4Q9QFI6_9GAMM|nr:MULTISPECIES: ABC transporter substrate-binding protein [Pseudomonas]TBU71628.1 ABC transporter substrate-binding protein [Pseudomonas daroniae]TBU74208.1 ABC transporter substrate-binding protein [Pseudomonas daroniae]TBU75105.1 ABC transporter substrate-binding protein [Pseudomonas sp. FRB 228]TBU86955.1 ABC transporter substrate-binding protein [Pseudomonas daroniae]